MNAVSREIRRDLGGVLSSVAASQCQQPPQFDDPQAPDRVGNEHAWPRLIGEGVGVKGLVVVAATRPQLLGVHGEQITGLLGRAPAEIGERLAVSSDYAGAQEIETEHAREVDAIDTPQGAGEHRRVDHHRGRHVLAFARDPTSREPLERIIFPPGHDDATPGTPAPVDIATAPVDIATNCSARPRLG